MVIDPDTIYLATITTAKGDIVLELYSQEAPVAVNNFIVLAELGFYDAMPLLPVGPPAALLTGDPTERPGQPRLRGGGRDRRSPSAGTMGYLRLPDQVNPER